MRRRAFVKTVAAGAGAIAVAPQVISASRGGLIQRENEKEGTTDWLLTKLQPIEGKSLDELCQRRPAIEAYCSHRSIQTGQTLTVFVSANPSTRFRTEIFRLGYYGGKGARRVGGFKPGREASPQPVPEEGGKHVIECRWKPTLEFKIPSDWVSGVYLGLMTTERDGFQAYFVFIVRDTRRADFLFQCSDITWQAYNRWPGWHSLYDFQGNKWHTSPGNEVGFDRPYSLYYNGLPAKFNPLTNGAGEFILWEHPLSFWIEREGYDVSYISNLDTQSNAKGLLRAKGFLSVGHDEYWTRKMYENVRAARDAGVNLAFLSGNSVQGEIVFKPSWDGRADRIFGRTEARGKDNTFVDENELMGAKSYGVGAADWICQAPEHWVFAGTNMKKGDAIPQLVGWEYHGLPLRNDPNLIVLASGAVRPKKEGPSGTYAATIYDGPKGNFVFNAATCWWSMPLSRPPGAVNPPNTDFSKEDVRVQQITRNIFERMRATRPA